LIAFFRRAARVAEIRLWRALSFEPATVNTDEGRKTMSENRKNITPADNALPYQKIKRFCRGLIRQLSFALLFITNEQRKSLSKF
jgi:hypothetical protein